MYAYRSKKSSYAKRKQTRRRAPLRRKRTGMRKRSYRKNTQVIASAEKKYFDYGVPGNNFAQYNDPAVSGSNGYHVSDQSLKCDQGLGVNARIGNKVFLTGAIMDLQFATQTSQTNAIKYKWFLVRIPDCYDYPPVDIVPAMFDTNPFNVNIFDWHSNRDPETGSQFKIVAKGQGTLRADSLAAQTSRAQIRRYLKLGFPCKFDNNVTGTPPITNQMRLIMFADTGGVSVGTGITGSVNLRVFYLDN